MSILEASFIVFRLRPYFRNFGKRLIKSPKIYFTEIGLAAYLLGIREAAQVAIHPLLGGLFENLVILEALKAGQNSGKDIQFYFFCDNNGLEVDLIVESAEGLLPIEIKAARTFSPEFVKVFPSIRKLDASFRPGVVIYAGELETNFKDTQIIHFSSTGERVLGG